VLAGGADNVPHDGCLLPPHMWHEFDPDTGAMLTVGIITYPPDWMVREDVTGTSSESPSVVPSADGDAPGSDVMDGRPGIH
jgi:hypothetical protein